jgi:hypothetical protein
VIHADEVQCPVHHGLRDVLGVLRADDDVAELAQRGRPRQLHVLVDREREHVGHALDPAVGLVELGDPLGVDELDREVALLDARGGERDRHEAAERLLGKRRAPDHLHVEHR